MIAPEPTRPALRSISLALDHAPPLAIMTAFAGGRATY